MSEVRRDRGSSADDAQSPRRCVLLLGADHWPEDLEARLVEHGYSTRSVSDLQVVAAQISDVAVVALFVPARPLGAREVLALRRIREASPDTAIVVLTRSASDPDVKRAFESGATTFLSWPFSSDSLRQALGSGRSSFRQPRLPS